MLLKGSLPARSFIFILVLLLLALSGISASAASLELSPTRKAAFDKSVDNAEPALRAKITGLYEQVLSLQKQELDHEDAIKALHYKNGEALIMQKARIKEIDAKLIAELEQKLRKKRDGYEPLFALYRNVNKKSKAAASMKIAVELARQDIRSVESKLKTAKSARTAKMKQVQRILAEIDKIKVRVNAEKSKVTQARKRFSSEWTQFGTAIKKDEPKRMTTPLSALVRHAEQIVQFKKAILAYEKQIEAVIAKAAAQIGNTAT